MEIFYLRLIDNVLNTLRRMHLRICQARIDETLSSGWRRLTLPVDGRQMQIEWHATRRTRIRNWRQYVKASRRRRHPEGSGRTNAESYLMMRHENLLKRTTLEIVSAHRPRQLANYLHYLSWRKWFYLGTINLLLLDTFTWFIYYLHR